MTQSLLTHETRDALQRQTFDYLDKRVANRLCAVLCVADGRTRQEVAYLLGVSGKTGSGRYSIINSLGNVPVAYMTFLDGRGAAHWGARGLPATEAVLGAIGGSILLTYFLTRPPKPPQIT